MKEYTVLSVLACIAAIAVDSRLKTYILRRKLFYVFFVVIIGFKLLVNGYLTAHIVRYAPRFCTGVRIGTIPVEDFIFGFSMVLATVVFWEYFKKKE